MKRKKLVIISHTSHYKTSKGQIVGWGATVNEINFLADYWDEVVHIGCLHQKEAPKSSQPYKKANIHFVAIAPFGGKTIASKLLIITKIPKIIREIRDNIKNASEVQLRLPTSIGLFLLPYFSFFVKRKFTFWVKYAGNWNQKHPPVSYLLQRWWLKKNIANCHVTINGYWIDQPEHCLSFENPCLTEQHISDGSISVKAKQFTPPFIFAFVGRLEDAKGVSELIDALQTTPLEKIKEVHFVGDGEQLETYKERTQFLGSKAVFHGFLESDYVHAILKAAHFFVLPSKSEGFPKALAEAACYGTIPVVSNVGSIDHYLYYGNGFIWKTEGNESYAEVLNTAVFSNEEVLKNKSKEIIEVAQMFTFHNYLKKLDKILYKR